MTAITTQTDNLDPNTTFVLHGDTDLGTIRDEHDAITTRGRYCAWSQKGAERRDGIVGFYATKDEAAAAIAKAHNIQPAPAAEPEHCVSVRGGAVHTNRPTEDDAWPLCRTGGQDSTGTLYTATRGELTCRNCLAQETYRALASATR